MVPQLVVDRFQLGQELDGVFEVELAIETASSRVNAASVRGVKHRRSTCACDSVTRPAAIASATSGMRRKRFANLARAPARSRPTPV